MRTSIIVFPGSNCDKDIFYSITNVLGKSPVLVWYKEEIPSNTDLIIIPGGFSFGDYLRCGSIAAKSNILKQINLFIKKGTKVLGICNGFQILTEAGFLPGMLLMNKSLKFICRNVNLRVTNNFNSFTSGFKMHETIEMPIAHKVGNYFINKEGLNKLLNNNQVVFRYSDKIGKCTNLENPNGSTYNIAGIIDTKGSIMGMMPHPERYYNNKNKDFIMKKILESLTNAK